MHMCAYIHTRSSKYYQFHLIYSVYRLLLSLKPFIWQKPPKDITTGFSLLP